MNTEINLGIIDFSSIEYLGPASRSATYKSYNIPEGVKRAYLFAPFASNYDGPSISFGGTSYVSSKYLSSVAGDAYSGYFYTAGYTWEIKFTGKAGTFTFSSPFYNSSKVSMMASLFIVYD